MQEQEITKIISHYGTEKQLDMVIEECSELIKAVCKLKRAGNLTISAQGIFLENVAEEVADVQVMLEQIPLIVSARFSPEAAARFEVKIKLIKDAKIDRTLARIMQEEKLGREYE